MKKKGTLIVFIAATLLLSCVKRNTILNDLKADYPWCIVAYDSPERTPAERISLLKEMGFSKYAYDWRDRHLDQMKSELELAKESDIEIISVWMWLNAKRDSLHRLSPSNERIFKILEESGTETTLWLSLSPNFFEKLSQEQSMKLAIEMVGVVNQKAEEIGCDIALYNHRGWFGDTENQVRIIQALSLDSLSIVYNFHHGHEDIDNFRQIVKRIMPYLSAVNLNGMRKGGPKILKIGEGDHETEMIKILVEEGFNGPWGILGHVEDVDVKKVMEENIKGLNSLKLSLAQ